MRPERLELEGFTVFREPTEIDFAGADLFALTGPTGSGKTSVIDAITFALYGAVARYDDAKLVRDVISKGLTEARVRLDFAVGDEQLTAVRVVRATATGATTKEARLERGDEVLASDARGMTTEVAGLLGLGFGQFNTCVVLPQGDFARFLHEKRADRQDLLVTLLDLGVYEEVGKVARQRATAAQAELTVFERELEKLGDVDQAALDEAGTRVRHLEVLMDRIREAEEPLRALDARAAAARAAVAETDRLTAALDALQVPEDVQELEAKLARAAEALDQFRKDEQRAEQWAGDAQKRRDELPDHADLGAAAREYERLTELEKQETALAKRAGEATEAATEAEAAQVGAKAAVEAAEAELDAAHTADAVHVVARTLVVGEPCPVCHQVVHDLPHHEAAGRVEAAREACAGARAQLRTAETAAHRAIAARQTAEERLLDVRGEVAELSNRLGGADAAAQVVRQLALWKEVEADLRRAQAAVAEARGHRTQAEGRLAALGAEEKELEAAYHAARDTVIALEPPVPGAGGLSEKWKDLLRWGVGQKPALEARREHDLREAKEAEKEAGTIRGRMRDTCTELGVDVGKGEPRDATSEALSAARSRHERLGEDLRRKDELTKQVADVGESRQVASALGDHLRAERFERWLLDEAVDRLVDEATATLTGLSGGAYSLTLDDQARFAVVDHANADAVRPARTLSGGETFLASLALALALAGQIAELSATGAPRLESILLDEGFGTLDAETLDTVASALEELGAEGRTVGIVTHVRELAERLPVRFEVRKGPATATVDRVDA